MVITNGVGGEKKWLRERARAFDEIASVKCHLGVESWLETDYRS